MATDEAGGAKAERRDGGSPGTRPRHCPAAADRGPWAVGRRLSPRRPQTQPRSR